MTGLPHSQPDITEARCDQALQMCDGNPRETIKAVLLANGMQGAEIAALQARVEELTEVLNEVCQLTNVGRGDVLSLQDALHDIHRTASTAISLEDRK